MIITLLAVLAYIVLCGLLCTLFGRITHYGGAAREEEPGQPSDTAS